MMVTLIVATVCALVAVYAQLKKVEGSVVEAVARVDRRERELQGVQEWTKEVFREITNLQMVKAAPGTAPLMMRERRLAESGPQAVAPPSPPQEVPQHAGRMVLRG